MADPKEAALDLSVLNELAPEHRTLVSSALKATLSKELANISGQPGGPGSRAAAEHTRESGPLHGSQHTKGSQALLDKDILTRVHGMDEKQFAEFSGRLAALRGKTGAGGG